MGEWLILANDLSPSGDGEPWIVNRLVEQNDAVRSADAYNRAPHYSFRYFVVHRSELPLFGMQEE